MTPRLRAATDAALELARSGLSTRDAVDSVAVRFDLGSEARATVEGLVDAALVAIATAERLGPSEPAEDPRRVRVDGVAIGTVRVMMDGWYRAEHDRYGYIGTYMDRDEAIRVIKAVQ